MSKHLLLQILDGCPWVAPKPLHVLAVPQPAAPQAAMFTLQTRASNTDVQSELNKVIKEEQYACARSACHWILHASWYGQEL